uniref:helix-turn-helix transcriptional regulator n=1 Tax=Rhodococcus qingshengii TaxID=334542 RepID=UPI002119D2AE|nr:helix-turn-helix domain-containing protein [Rhodococcus qingshengii]
MTINGAINCVEQRDMDGVRRSLASRREVAEYVGVPAQTVAVWAMKGTGPKYRLIGRHARYDWADVDAWLDAHPSGGSPTND